MAIPFFGFRSNARRPAQWHRITFALLAAALLFLAGCSNGSESTLPVGTWESSFGEVYEIEATSIRYLGDGSTVSWAAEVVLINDSALNGGDTSVTASGAGTVNPGFAVIRYTQVNNAGSGEVGKYNVFRWAESDDTPGALLMTQGSKDADLDGDGDPFTGTYVNVVFDTAAAARAGATNDAGHFALASTVTAR